MSLIFNNHNDGILGLTQLSAVPTLVRFMSSSSNTEDAASLQSSSTSGEVSREKGVGDGTTGSSSSGGILNKTINLLGSSGIELHLPG